MFLAKEKGLYQTMNMMVLNKQTFIAYFWAPADEQSTILRALEPLRAVRVSAYENHSIPKPTYIKTNEFTEVF
jgi:vacuolar-type H+-ATPase subunit I/STV1